MRYNRPRRNRFRSNDQDFRKNGSHDLRAAGVNGASSFQRRPFNRNGIKAEKLLEKYNNLAKEASSNGDNILSESYYQHADHYARMVEDRISNQVVNKAPVATEEKTTNDNSNLNSDISKTQDIENKK